MRFELPVVLLSGCMALVGCGPASERNVITERAPFYQTEVALGQGRSDAVIEAVRSFSKLHQMDFLLARADLQPGEFNASADGPSINLTAMHIATFDTGVEVTAIARADPTPQDRALVAAFVARIRGSAVADRPGGNP
jgi:hypothetical protein